MSVLTETIDELRQIEEALYKHPALAQRVHAIAAVLGSEITRWLNLTEAVAVLELYPERVIVDWAQIGLLRSRYLPDGSLQVHLGDVLQQKRLYAALAAGWPDTIPAVEEQHDSGTIDLAEMSLSEHAIIARARAKQRQDTAEVPMRNTELA